MDKISVGTFVIALWLCYTLRADIVSAGESLKKPGDTIIGGLVSVHQKESGDSCVTPDLHGILTVEAILFALKAINGQKYLTLGSKLGCDIRDTCPSPASAAYGLTGQPLAAAVGNLPQQLLENQRALIQLLSSKTPHMSCITSTYKVKDRLDLVSRAEFIFHAIARDRSNLRAIVHLAARFDWTYVGVVHDDSDEGKYEADLFQQEAEQKFVCVGRKYSLASNASGVQIQKFISSLKAEKNFSVVVMLTSKRIFKGIIDEAFKQKISDVTWIGSESSWDNEARFPIENTAAQGMFKVGTPSIAEFKGHLQGLLTSPKRNKWIMNMVASEPVTAAPDANSTVESTSPPTQAPVASSVQLNSSSNSTGNTTTPLPSTPASSPSTAPATPSKATPTKALCNDPLCGVNKTSLQQLVETLKSMADSATCTIDSIFAVAHALSAKEKCKTNCPEDHDFFKFIKNVNFTSLSGNHISFNSQRNLNDVEYRIWTLQKTGNGSAVSAQEQKNLRPSKVGSWKQSGRDTPELTLRPSTEIKWNTKEDKIPKSACHDPCKPGTYKALKETRSEAECCWQCLPCAENSVSEMEDSLACKPCPAGSAASNEQDECITQFEDYVYWNDAGSLVMLFLMVAGVCFSVYVAVVLFRNRETPVMRRAKNATLLLLPFVVILFLIPIPVLSKPNEASCEGYRAFFILTLGVPLAALISKSVFVDNRYYDSDGQIKESWGQCICTPRLAFAIGAFTIHVIATILIAVLLPNEILRYPTDDPFTVYIECSIHTGFGFLVVIFYIMAVTTVYSIMSMNEEITPENDMEVRWTSFCMFMWYVICFLYVAIEYGAVGKGKILGLAFVDFLFAINILACIYLPKWYVIVFQPEKNQADVSPWSMYVKTQEKVSVRLSEGQQESPVLPKRGTLASMAKGSSKMSNGDPDMDGKSESAGLINDTDV